MAFKICDVLDAESGPAVGALESQHLAFGFRTCDPAAAVGGDPPAADSCIDALVLRQGIFQPHQHDDAAPLPRPEAGGARVVNAHVFGRERTQLGEADQLEGIDTKIHAAGEGHVRVTAQHCGSSMRHREQ